MNKIEVGTVLTGYCHGYFSDFYGDKVCIAKGKYKGEKWATFFLDEFDHVYPLFMTVSGHALKDISDHSENFKDA